ncbi:FAD-dependent oxidoreductase [Devosia oryziradicis]|uniref:FAD-dependent oxidoreductase n=1 Tax=Devosia oryziradicis TaxID=2801335 RepID=A0ABX7BUJ0_9HYPH|nr:FAD-dependent oxidoreductase [Devosia oryziradicis]QQR35629.1 FAD-dependent oxidoreductase [Devosia oryziradicis]
MKDQPNRIGVDRPHQFHGSAIDRGRPLKFRLDGRLISGLAGDTVLSAVLASGLDTIGEHNGTALALSQRHAPTISFAALAADHQRTLPMERTPATDGADYISTARKLQRNPLLRLMRRGRSLNIDLDRGDALARPWIGSPAEAGPAADLVVVGGGVAGLSSALAAAKRGLRVVLIEATPMLGGNSRLFGTLEGEQTPDEQIDRLATAVTNAEAITVLTNAEAFALRPGVVRLHQVEMIDDTPTGRVVEIKAPHIVLATGSFERLPIFPGNRLPGTIGALEAFELAHRYGVWAGSSALVATSSSPAYRLAMLANDAGITVPRIIDSRPNPQSRFIEFSKAYGITLAAGTLVASAASASKGRGLVATPLVALGAFQRSEPAISVDRLVLCGGWQPDLTLWHMAGGQSAWNAARARLEPRSGPAGIALAGSAAGWFSRGACVESGGDAVDALLGRQRRVVEERLIDPIYETPDAPAPIGEVPDEVAPPSYLDGGWRHIERPRLKASRWPSWLPFAPALPGWSLADTPQPLDIADIAAGVQLGAIPAASAGIVAQERVAMVVIEAGGNDPQPSQALAMPPPYLEGRYDGASLWLVAPKEARALDVGALIYRDADETDPLKAIGVVVRIVDGKAVALVAGQHGQSASVREPGRAVGITLAAPYREGGSANA